MAVRSDAVVEVLVVDDAEEDFLIASDMLSSVVGSKYKLDFVQRFEEAIDAVGSHDYSALLIDYRLGEQTGLDLVRLLRAEGVDTPMIMMTGQGDLDVDLAAADAGATTISSRANLARSYLTVPFDMQ